MDLSVRNGQAQLGYGAPLPCNGLCDAHRDISETRHSELIPQPCEALHNVNKSYR